jgi:hypothetical protein
MMRIELRTGQLLAAALTLLLGAPVAAQDALHISPEGRVGIGRDAPVAPLDISGAPRTGTHPGMLGGLYVTGNFPPGARAAARRPASSSVIAMAPRASASDTIRSMPPGRTTPRI